MVSTVFTRLQGKIAMVSTVFTRLQGKSQWCLEFLHDCKENRNGVYSFYTITLYTAVQSWSINIPADFRLQTTFKACDFSYKSKKLCRV